MLVVIAIALVSAGAQAGDESSAQGPPRPPQPGTGGRLRRVFAALDGSIVQASVAGLWLGLFFVFLGQPESDTPLWPAAAATVASAVAVGALVPVLRPGLHVPLDSLGAVSAVGIFQTLGTVTFVVAASGGMLSVVSVAGALTPVPTAILAIVLLRERLTRLQLTGMIAAVVGIVMMV
jgi:drug/metabolite transporter (DMT)-like permease